MRLNPLLIQVVITFLFTIPFSVFAQTDYVVTAKGDTLKGELKILSYDLIDRIQITDLNKKTTYTALQIRSLSKDGIVFRPEQYENTIRFMKVLKDGFLSYYAFSLANQNSWDGRYLKKKDGTGMEVPNLSFKKMLAKYLQDCDEIRNRIEQGEFSKRDIERIVDLYNICMQTKTDAVITKHETPPIIFNSEKILAVKNLITQVEAENFLTKKDALDMLKDIQSKVSKNETIPNYLIEGLKSYLTDTPNLAKEFDTVVALLKK